MPSFSAIRPTLEEPGSQGWIGHGSSFRGQSLLANWALFSSETNCLTKETFSSERCSSHQVPLLPWRLLTKTQMSVLFPEPRAVPRPPVPRSSTRAPVQASSLQLGMVRPGERNPFTLGRPAARLGFQGAAATVSQSCEPSEAVPQRPGAAGPGRRLPWSERNARTLPRQTWASLSTIS